MVRLPPRLHRPPAGPQTAGDNTETFADGILTDPDLDGLRELPSYRRLAAKASAYLKRLREVAMSTGK